MSTLSDQTGICTWRDWGEFFVGLESYGRKIHGEDWDYWSRRMLARMTGQV